MERLRRLEGEACSILFEAWQRFGSMALLWSMGKDSTTLLYLARRTFQGEIPFPVVHLDTSYKFDEIYTFRERLRKEWNLPLEIVRGDAALAGGMSPERGRQVCCHALKTQPLVDYVQSHGVRALALAIRRDEHAVRAKERVFSPRNADAAWNYQAQPPDFWGMAPTEPGPGGHVRVHPMLEWTEEDVWECVRRHDLPTLDLYFAKQGVRYRSVGCRLCCQPVPGTARNPAEVVRELKLRSEAERSGRAQDKEDEYAMLKLRSLGYM